MPPDSFISGGGTTQRSSNKPSYNAPDETPSNNYFEQSLMILLHHMDLFSECTSFPFLLSQAAQCAYRARAQSRHDSRIYFLEHQHCPL